MQKNNKYQEKHCTECYVILTDNNSKAYNRKHSKYVCDPCLKIKNNKKYLDNIEYITKRIKAYEASNRSKIITAYGGKCVCCGENTPEFLSTDHIDCKGAEERKNTNQGAGGKMHRWLIKHNFPKNNYQLLCYNCNCAKGFFGYCPHQNKSKSIG